MVNYLNREDLPDNFDLILYSDIHVGAKSFHAQAFHEMLEQLKQKRTYAVCLGDLVEGQSTDHHHYDHTAIDTVGGYDLHTPDGQFKLFSDLIEPRADKHLGILKGNHDWRFDKVRPFVAEMCRELGVNYLGPRAHLRAGAVNLFLSHIGRNLPRGAKDPRQRRANREAALKRNLEPMWGSAHGMFHGHTHDLLLAKPVPDNTELLMGDGGEHRMRTVRWADMGAKTSDGFELVHPEARFYGVTGTFRRSGHVQDVTNADDFGARTWDDYSEKFNYPPSPIGYIRLEVRKGVLLDGREVVV